MATVKELNNFVNAFFQAHIEDSGEEIKGAWAQSDTQTRLKNLLGGKGVGRRKKDPNAPKRGKTSYLFFCEAKREVVKTENPDMNAKEVTSELGVRWNLLKENSPNEVAKYVKLADTDKGRYEDEKANYVPSPEALAAAAGGRGSKRQRDPNAPKRPKSGYLFFCQAVRSVINQEQPDLGAKDVTTELGARWNVLKETKPKEVAKYIKMAEADKARYEDEKAAYEIKKKGADSEEEHEEAPKKVKAAAKPAAKAPAAKPAAKAKVPAASKPAPAAKSGKAKGKK
jgi:hypothetical protein